MLAILNIASEVVFTGWLIMRIWYHIAAGNAGWAAACSAMLVVSIALLAGNLIE